ncbi:uncharacterized protein [Eurosta solidaginis]|uniref:uncharacterized protein n=1 Tax=Eurosta solidaginis TaxID=178769 RepID=UPI0035315B53
MNYNGARALFLLQTIWCLQLTHAIMSHPETKKPNALTPNNRLGGSYLSQQRPLWILEDRVRQNDYAEFNYSTDPYNSYQTQHKQIQEQQKLYSNAPQIIQTRQRQPHAISVPQQKRPMHAKYIAHPRPRRPSQRLRTYKHTPRAYFAQHYQPLRRVNFQRRLKEKQTRFTNSKLMQQSHRREQYIPRLSLPTFDSVPGDDSLDAAPIFIYTGPKGAIILNTMLSAPTYQMQEPVPGQVLYPPNVPIFRPKPIVERFRMPGSAQILNLTLIPFYAHEAVDMPHVSRMLQQDAALSQEATTMQPTVVYETSTVKSSFSSAADTKSTPETLRWRMKKSKHYSAYHSPNEVQWTPMSADRLRYHTASTTPFPLTAPSPPQNHRFAADMVTASTTSASFNNYEITYKSDADSAENTVERDELSHNDNRLGNIYVDDSLEKPATSSQTTQRVSSRYALTKELYAFPIFTLGKLLKKEPMAGEKHLAEAMVESTLDNPLAPAQVHQEKHVTQSVVDSDSEAEENAVNDEDDVETWFILNSRYKGQRSQKNNEYRLSSKYVHTTDQREPNEISS